MSKTELSETWWMKNGVPGDVFYTQKDDKQMTASAVYYKRKITTERIAAFNIGDFPDAPAERITKVTILA
jgi:hypothetical protein